MCHTDESVLRCDRYSGEKIGNLPWKRHKEFLEKLGTEATARLLGSHGNSDDGGSLSRLKSQPRRWRFVRLCSRMKVGVYCIASVFLYDDNE